VSSNGLTIPLDYTSAPNDEMSAKLNLASIGKTSHDESDVVNKDWGVEKLKAAGWTMVETTGFLSLVGPLWQRIVDGAHEYAIRTEDKHHNRRGLVQGGLVMTLADRSSGMMARVVADRPTLATIQMDTLFIDSARIGELLVSRPRVIRATRSLIFTTTEVTADDRTVASASGVFKILKNDS
jgi:acyl-coenzyme A thioesterase PaaI-like protein